MENERTENIFYLNLKHVHKYGCAKFQPNPLFSSQQTATESAAEKTKKKHKKSRQPLKGIQSGDGMPQLVHTTMITQKKCLLVLIASAWSVIHENLPDHRLRSFPGHWYGI